MTRPRPSRKHSTIARLSLWCSVGLSLCGILHYLWLAARYLWRF